MNGNLHVEDVARTKASRCDCSECKPCRNRAALSDEVVTSPALCTPCLYGCAP